MYFDLWFFQRKYYDAVYSEQMFSGGAACQSDLQWSACKADRVQLSAQIVPGKDLFGCQEQGWRPQPLLPDSTVACDWGCLHRGRAAVIYYLWRPRGVCNIIGRPACVCLVPLFHLFVFTFIFDLLWSKSVLWLPEEIRQHSNYDYTVRKDMHCVCPNMQNIIFCSCAGILISVRWWVRRLRRQQLAGPSGKLRRLRKTVWDGSRMMILPPPSSGSWNLFETTPPKHPRLRCLVSVFSQIILFFVGPSLRKALDLLRQTASKKGMKLVIFFWLKQRLS